MGMAVALFIIVSGIRLVIETANPLLGLPQQKIGERIGAKELQVMKKF